MPKTSQMTPNSNGAICGTAMQAMEWSTDGLPERASSGWQECVDHWRVCHFRQDVARSRIPAMDILFFLLLAALAVWGVVSTLTRLDSDGYGRPEIRDRVRHIENRPPRNA
jgi:hypothetical protein